MTFVYNGKLPCYSWGASGINDNSGPAYDITSDMGRLAVPLAENGGQKLYFSTGSRTQTIAATYANCEANPCDVQMPWRDFVAFRSIASPTVVGLTVHGELYILEAAANEWAVGPAGKFADTRRRLSKVYSPLNQEPFSNVCICDPVAIFSGATFTGSQYAVAITRDGKAWHVRSRSQASATTLGQLDEISLPSGVSAHALWSISQPNAPTANTSMYLLTDTNDKTYVRNSKSNAWYQLTDGCYAQNTHNTFGNRWLNNDLPTLTVDAPPSGTRATVSGVWVLGPTYANLTAVRVTNPGSGYTSNPSVTLSRAGDIVLPGNTGATPDITLKVFSAHVIDLPHLGSFETDGRNDCITNNGERWSLNIPPQSVDTVNESGSVAWATETTPRYNNNTKLSTRMFFPSPNVTGLYAYLLGTDKKLYRYVSDWELFDEGPWDSVARNFYTMCGVKSDGTMWTWGKNGIGSGTDSDLNINRAFFGDSTELGTLREYPSQIAADAEWLRVRAIPAGFVAIRKDAICRQIDQPMEYWPDWHYQTQT